MKLVLILGLTILSVPAFASVDMVVRLREPVNSVRNLSKFSVNSALGPQADIINGEEGVVRYRFNTLAEAKAARAQLERSNSVLNITPNALYHPAVRYQIEDSSPEVERNSFLGLPYFVTTAADASATTPGIPDVQLPPSNPADGKDPLTASDWAMAKIGMSRIQGISSDASVGLVARDSQIITAVIDTGVDYNHEDLVGAMWRNPSDAKEVGYDFAHDNAKPYDNLHFDVEGCMKDYSCRLGLDTSKFLVNPGHGTHCAGHVGAVYNNALGIRGVGAGAPVVALKFFYDFGEQNAGSGDDAAAIKAIDYAIKHGVKVISASWGGRMERKDGEQSELKEAIVRAQKAGVIMVIAAGNDSVNQDTVEDPSYPAAYDLDNLIIVAASDKNDGLASFSNYGAKSVHLAAPGVKILSTTVGSKYSDLVAKFKDAQGKSHEIAWDGTSMATPIVAGAVALVWSKNPTADYHTIRDKILKSVRKVPALAGKVQTGGVLDVAAALKAE